jgi:hypothetical protein
MHRLRASDLHQELSGVREEIGLAQGIDWAQMFLPLVVLIMVCTMTYRGGRWFLLKESS